MEGFTLSIAQFCFRGQRYQKRKALRAAPFGNKMVKVLAEKKFQISIVDSSIPYVSKRIPSSKCYEIPYHL